MVRAAAVAFFLLPAAALAQSCPEPLASAKRLVLVTADTMATTSARLTQYERDGSAWRKIGGDEPALIGKKGMAWAPAFRALARPAEPVKTEGDKRAPAGFYTIGASFGFAPSDRANYLQIREGTVCVDDLSSPAYNTIATRAEIGPNVRGENMSRVQAYRHGLLVNYPTDAKARAGSCIFIHLWMPDAKGTAGCVALREPQLAALQDFAAPGAILAILPNSARGRLSCLPR